MQRLLLIALILFPLMGAKAAMEVYSFSNARQEQQFHELTQRLRCPKCQNNSIADSNSMIARDMRQKVFSLLQQGDSPEQITDYMIARYGHFVSYQPPLTPVTLWLWLLPLLFIIIGFLQLWRLRGTNRKNPQLTQDQQQRLAKLVQSRGKKC